MRSTSLKREMWHMEHGPEVNVSRWKKDCLHMDGTGGRTFSSLLNFAKAGEYPQ